MKNLKLMGLSVLFLALTACATQEKGYLNPLVDPLHKPDPERFEQQQLIMYQRFIKDKKLFYKQINFDLYDPKRP